MTKILGMQSRLILKINVQNKGEKSYIFKCWEKDLIIFDYS